MSSQLYEIPLKVRNEWWSWWLDTYEAAPAFQFHKTTLQGGIMFLAPLPSSTLRPFIEAMKGHPDLLFQSQGEGLVDENRFYGTWSAFSADPVPDLDALQRARLAIPVLKPSVLNRKGK